MAISVGGISIASDQVGGDHYQLVALPPYYEVVAASDTTELVGTSGAVGNYISSITIVPETTSPGSVKIRDGSGGSDITLFTGGTLPSVASWTLDGTGACTNASNPGWYVSTGANVHVIMRGVW